MENLFTNRATFGMMLAFIIPEQKRYQRVEITKQDPPDDEQHLGGFVFARLLRGNSFFFPWHIVDTCVTKRCNEKTSSCKFLLML